MNRRQPCTSFTSTNQETPERIYRILNNRSPNKKRSGQGDESRQRKRSEAHWSLVNVCSTTNLTLNKFFPKNFIIHAPRILPRIRHPTTHNRLRTRRHLDQISLFHRLSRQNLKWPECKKSSGKSSGKTEDKIIASARKSPSVSIPQMAEILGISTRAVEKQIRQLKQSKRLRRIGPPKGGNWQVVT